MVMNWMGATNGFYLHACAWNAKQGAHRSPDSLLRMRIPVVISTGLRLRFRILLVDGAINVFFVPLSLPAPASQNLISCWLGSVLSYSPSFITPVSILSIL